MRSAFDTSCREDHNTHFMFKYIFLKNCAVYEIMWKNMVQSDRPHMTIQFWVERTHFACWINKARIQTHTHYINT
jgi:hypothetical protein